ncbi:MAG TPA: right-handed parallel beta-helix repeat-containing protein [Sedimentisphaerales bacterium]|nr:right-handed parallel beta-helix repeat-containing protein [Sedimentisphaerales bacterium]
MDSFRSYLYTGTMALLTLTITIGCHVVPVSSPAPTAQIQAAGSVYYVAPTGDDSNPGTQTQPWRTIQKAANTMVVGDSTTVLAGDYSERVKVTRSGAPAASITYQAEGTVTMKGFTVRADYITIGGFDISDTDNVWDEGWGIFVEGSYCVVDGNYVHFATRGGITIWASSGNESRASHCIVKNNRLYRNALAGIEVYGRDNLIEGNEIWGTIQYHPKWVNPPTWVDADGIRFFGAGHIIRKNYIHDISFNDPENVDPHIDCFQTWGTADHNGAQSIVIEQNLCQNLQFQTIDETGQGFMLEEASNLTIRNNVIHAYKGVNTVGSRNLTIVNNTFVSELSITPAGASLGVLLQSTPYTTIKNNAFYDFPDLAVSVGGSVSRQGLDAGYNCAYRSDGRAPAGSPYPHDLWNVNPMFVDPVANDYHLRPDSPAVDAGITLENVVNDFDSNPRPQGTAYDIGAYEVPMSRKTASASAARTGEIITFTISIVVTGRPVTVTDALPNQLAYLSSMSACPGTTTYNASARRVTYSGTPPSGLACVLQISVRIDTNQTIAVTNSATIDSGQSPPQAVSVMIILNGLDLYLPIIYRSS